MGLDEKIAILATKSAPGWTARPKIEAADLFVEIVDAPLSDVDDDAFAVVLPVNGSA